MVINNIPVYTLQHVNFGSYVVRHGSQPFNTVRDRMVNVADFVELNKNKHLCSWGYNGAY